MKNELTPLFASMVLKIDKKHKARYSIRFTNIEVENIKTKEIKFINIHEFIHVHCRDFLLSYANGLMIKSYSMSSKIDSRIPILYFEINITVPNLCSGKNPTHVEMFIGVSEPLLYIQAVEWLIKYRKDNPKLSKFWINRF